MTLHEEKGKPPVLMGIAESKNPTVVMYGHIDKQPPLTESWRKGLHPYKSVIEGNKLYGRGGGDDGYAWFMAISLIKTLQHFKIEHNRFVLFFETEEESGSEDLMYWMAKLKKHI